jgi:arylsulfatase
MARSDHSETNFPKKEGGFYSTETFTDELLGYLKERKESTELSEKPFFAYYAFTAPHWPLQAKKEYRDKYKGMYDDGPLALRDRRLKQLAKLGLIDPSASAHPLINPQRLPEWDAMTEQEKALSSRAMETYAAMVELIDEHVGRVIDQLEEDGELDNTFVLFMSDK